MAGNLLDYPAVRLDLIGLRDELDTIGQQLHNAVHHHDQENDRENVKAAADEVMQAWAKVSVALVNLDTVRPAVTTVRVRGGVL